MITGFLHVYMKNLPELRKYCQKNILIDSMELYLISYLSKNYFLINIT